MEPVVQSIFHTEPGFCASEVDVFACGSTFGSLLRFVRGIDKPFRFDVEVIGSSVFFIRKNNDPKETIPDVRGFGHTFPEAYTTWEQDVKRSETHQRVVQYDFGGLICMIRFESDGYLGTSSIAKSDSGKNQKAEGDVDDLLQPFGTVSVSDTSKLSENRLEIKSGGSKIPRNKIFDLKTRSKKWGIDMSDFYPLLWIKQIPNFVIAYHDGRGHFSDVKGRNVEDEVSTWETDNVDAIKRFSILIRKIVDIAKSDKTGRLDVYCPCNDKLEIHRQLDNDLHTLPLSLRTEWESADGQGGLESPEDVATELKLSKHIDSSYDSDEDDAKDYTACSNACGYCGRCTY